MCNIYVNGYFPKEVKKIRENVYILCIYFPLSLY